MKAKVAPLPTADEDDVSDTRWAAFERYFHDKYIATRRFAGGARGDTVVASSAAAITRRRRMAAKCCSAQCAVCSAQCEGLCTSARFRSKKRSLVDCQSDHERPNWMLNSYSCRNRGLAACKDTSNQSRKLARAPTRAKYLCIA